MFGASDLLHKRKQGLENDLLFGKSKPNCHSSVLVFPVVH